MSAQNRGWGPPGLTAEQHTLVTCPGIPLYVRNEVAPIFAALVRWLADERNKAGVPPLRSAGGYNFRRIAGTDTWSNHAWGLAADFNPDTNPYARNGRTDMPDGTGAKARSLGMRWGGDFTGKRDAMHFEFMGTPADALHIRNNLAGRPNVDTFKTARFGDTGDTVRRLQGRLNALGASLIVDGKFGNATRDRVRTFQKIKRLTVDGIVGPNTWSALYG